MPSTTFNPLMWPCGKENIGGYTGRVVFIPMCIVVSMPTLPAIADIVDDKDYATAAGAFTFVDAGHKPTPIYATDKTVAYTAENQGDEDGRSFAVSGSFFHPGSSVENAAFARKVNNTPGYLVIEEFGGNQILIGQPGIPVSIAPAFAGGQARADRKGTTYNFSSDSIVPYIYLETPLNLDTLFAEANGVDPEP